MSTLLVLFITLIGGLLILAIITGWSLGLGWLLTRFLDFSLFEASLLGLLASAATGSILARIIRAINTFTPEPDLMFDDDDFYPIPPARFYENVAERTWGDRFRYEIANNIYITLQDSPRVTGEMGDEPLKELSIRLADVSAAFMKSRSPRAKRLRVMLSELKQQMKKMGLRPYDDDILALAVEVINEELEWPEMERIVRDQLWDESDIPDMWD